MSSLYTIEQMKELADALEADGFTPDLLKVLMACGRLTAVKAVLEGRAEITVVEVKAPEPKKIVPVALKGVASDGISGEDGIRDLEEAGCYVDDYAKNLMKKPAYVATNGKVYKPVVFKGGDFTGDERVTSNIREIAEKMGLITPPAELARLLRRFVSDEEIAAIGLWALIVMHDPIIDSGSNPNFLCLNRDGRGRCLVAYYGRANVRWDHECGFVFLAPQE